MIPLKVRQIFAWLAGVPVVWNSYWCHRVRQYICTPRVSFLHKRLPLLKRANVDIAFAFDKNLVTQAAVTITSLMDVSKDRCDYNFYCVVDDSVTDEHKAMISKYVTGGSTIKFLAGNSDFDTAYLRTKKPLPRPTWFRLMLPKLLPDLDKVIYTDLDVIFINDLAEAADLDLGDNLVAGVLDAHRDDYINAGFTILNLKAMRDEGFYPKFIEHSKIQYQNQDQDVLNILCKGRIMFLPRRYNFAPKASWYMKCTAREYSDLKYHTVMLHFYDRFKPWAKQKPFLGYIWQYYERIKDKG